MIREIIYFMRICKENKIKSLIKNDNIFLMNFENTIFNEPKNLKNKLFQRE